MVSAITEAELLVAPLRVGGGADRALHSLLGGPAGIRVLPATRAIARSAARLRADLGLRLADALVVATAVDSGCTALVSNDTGLRRLDDAIDALTYVHLDDHLPHAHGTNTSLRCHASAAGSGRSVAARGT